MTDILVKARLRQGHKAELAAHLSGGTLAKGNPYEDRIQQALRLGYGIDHADDAYFTFTAADQEKLPDDAKRVLERFFVIDREVPREAVPPGEIARIEGLTPLPEWLGIDVEGWRND